MATIAVSLIGHNNGHQLARCLDSVRWADEVIYVDCESQDDSLAIARRYTDKVHQRPNDTNLNVNKSYGFQQATTEWIFYLDPDEMLPPALGEEIRAVIAGNPAENAFALPRRNHYFGRWLRHGGQYPDTQLRLFRRGKARFACRDVHERLEVEGRTGRLREAMNHYPCDTPAEAIGKLDFYSTFNAEQMARAGMRPTFGLGLRMLVVKPLRRFVKRYWLQGGFLDGMPGLIVISIGAIDFLYRFYKLWYLAHHPEVLPVPGEAAQAGAAEPGSGDAPRLDTRVSA